MFAAIFVNVRIILVFSESFFISEPEGGKSCSNSPAPEPGLSRKDIIDIRKSGGSYSNAFSLSFMLKLL